MKKISVVAVVIGASMSVGNLYASDFTSKAACPAGDDVIKFMSTSEEFTVEKIQQMDDHFMEKIPENKKVIQTTEGDLTLHWEVTDVAGSKFHRAEPGIEAAQLRNSLSSYTPQSQKCVYQLRYKVAPGETTPILTVTFERLKEGV